MGGDTIIHYFGYYKKIWLLEKFESRPTGWWFQTFFIFTPIWGRFPFWLIFFRWVETTNQQKNMIVGEIRIKTQHVPFWKGLFLNSKYIDTNHWFQEISNRTHWTDPKTPEYIPSSNFLRGLLVRSHSIFDGLIFRGHSFVFLAAWETWWLQHLDYFHPDPWEDDPIYYGWSTNPP